MMTNDPGMNGLVSRTPAVLGKTRWVLTGCALFLMHATGVAGTWTRLANNAPGNVHLMLLLTDGTVMAADSGVSNSWYKLTPDSQGSYVNGTWSTLSTMADTRLYYCSYVMRDGRVFIAGGEYGTGGARCEIYNPLTDIWSSINVPTSTLDPTQQSPALAPGGKQQFSDSGGVMLPDGRIQRQTGHAIDRPVVPRNRRSWDYRITQRPDPAGPLPKPVPSDPCL